MFRKLISNLPFNPGLLDQVAFYAKRIKQERFVRRIGFLFMSITMVVHTLMFISPPQKSLATSSNSIINGLQTRNDILNAWDNPTYDIMQIYSRFGLQRTDIEALPMTPNATVTSTDADYWTIGRNSLLSYSNVKQEFKDSQLTIRFDGEQTEDPSDDKFVYQRQLKAWDIINASNTYKAFKGTIAATGETFWILKDCGNFTKIGKTQPPAPPAPQPPTPPSPAPSPPTPAPPTPPTPPPAAPTPELEIRKSIDNQKVNYAPGDTFTYTISFRNKTVDSLADKVVIDDQLDTKYFALNDIQTSEYSIQNGFFHYEYGSLAYSANFKVVTIEVRLKDQISSGSNVCNEARVTSTNAAAKTSNKVCVGVIVKCPFDASIADVNNPNCVEPKLVCNTVDFALNRTTRKASLRTTATSTNPANTKLISYRYDFGDRSEQTFSSTSLTHETDHTYQPGTYNIVVTVSYRTTGQTETKDKTTTCTASVSFDSDQPLGQSKAVANITQNTSGDIAQRTIVKAGDVLEYTITTTNTQGYERANVTVSDYIGDVLDYANLDTAKLNESHGSLDASTNKLVWKNVTVPANGSVKHTFRVKIKDPIPSTNQPSTLGTDFDCKISNEYGNEITMNINCPLVKSVEHLPNTGAGSSMFITGLLTLIVGYFFARSRLIAKELDIVRTDFAGGRL